MKTHLIYSSALLALICSVSAQAALPEKEFACKVQTQSLHLGAVLVQAHDMASAVHVAKGALAERMEGGTETVQLVLECVRFPQGRFTDSGFQAFVENMPR